MKKRFALPLIALLFSALPSRSFGQDLSPQEIVKRSDDLMRGETQEGFYTMTITTPNWERTLKLYVAGKGRDKVLIRVLSPAKEKGATTLRVKDEMWNYLPRVERIVKIPPSMMLEPWMGSDFANDDMVREKSVVNDYTPTLLAEEKLDGQDVYVIELVPKPEAGVIWGKRVMRIRKADLLPARDEFYAKGGKLVKTLSYENIQKVSDRTIPATWKMASEVKKGHRTTIEVDKKVVYNGPIDDSVFVLENLGSFLE